MKNQKSMYCGRTFLKFLLDSFQKCPAGDEPFPSFAATLSQMQESIKGVDINNKASDLTRETTTLSKTSKANHSRNERAL